MSGTSTLWLGGILAQPGPAATAICRHYQVRDPAVRTHPVTNRCEVTLARFRVRSEPCRTPAGYWDPGFTTTVRPSLLVARDSWMWPQSATTGCTSSMDSRMAWLPTG